MRIWRINIKVKYLSKWVNGFIPLLWLTRELHNLLINALCTFSYLIFSLTFGCSSILSVRPLFRWNAHFSYLFSLAYSLALKTLSQLTNVKREEFYSFCWFPENKDKRLCDNISTSPRMVLSHVCGGFYVHFYRMRLFLSTRNRNSYNRYLLVRLLTFVWRF